MSEPILRLGDTGQGVSRLQRLIFCRNIDGVFDDVTETRLRGYQYAHGLQVTGWLDLETAESLRWDVT